MNQIYVRCFLMAVSTLFCQLGDAQVAADDAVAVANSRNEVASDSNQKIRVLIVDGQNNHVAWPKSTIMMRDFLLETGKFSVDIERTRFTWKGGKLVKQFPLDDGKEYQDLKQSKTDPDFKPNFSDYDVVVSNFGYKAAEWPEETKTSFEQYMKNGGGFVSIHAADNCFPKWKQYNVMIGLGGWDGRNENSGPYVYFDGDGQQVRDDSKGSGGGHGPQHEFSIVIRDDDHPITAGLPDEFMHSKDELYQTLRGPAEGMTVLATAYADKQFKGSGRHEPMLMTVEYGDGRVFHTTLGHADYSFESVGFITTFLRGTEWAATGKVTIEVPEDFPTADKSSVRKYEAGKVASE